MIRAADDEGARGMDVLRVNGRSAVAGAAVVRGVDDRVDRVVLRHAVQQVVDRARVAEIGGVVDELALARVGLALAPDGKHELDIGGGEEVVDDRGPERRRRARHHHPHRKMPRRSMRRWASWTSMTCLTRAAAAATMSGSSASAGAFSKRIGVP